MVKLSLKVQLIDLDLKLKEILRLYQSVPSEYAQGKLILDEVRSLVVDSEIKKACRKADKALASFKKEQIVASEFNRIWGSLGYRNAAIESLRNDYLRAMAIGDYDAAKEIVDKLAEIRPLDSEPVKRASIEASIISGGDGSAAVRVANTTARSVTVTVTLFDGATKMKARKARFPYTLPPNAIEIIEYVPAYGNGVFTGTVNYRDSDGEKSIDLEKE